MNIRLASGSAARRALLQAAGFAVEVVPAGLDEPALRRGMAGWTPRRVAGALALAKARAVARAHPRGLTLGADQVLDLDGAIRGKPASPAAAEEMLRALSGRRHRLHSALALCEGERLLWRHVSSPRLTMLPLSDGFIRTYVARHWVQIRHCAGAYRIEAEGITLFSAIGTDYHAVMGLPLLPLLDFLRRRGDVTT